MEELMQEYLEYRKTLGLSPETIKLDQVALRKFKAYLEEKSLTINRVTTAEIKKYWDTLQTHNPATIRKYLFILKEFFGYCHRRHHILNYPFHHLEIPNYREQLPQKIPTLQQLKQILAAIDLSTWFGRRDRAILELVYSAGLRLSETTGLNLSDLDLANRLIRVRGKGAKERIIPFGKTAAFYIKLYLKDRPNHLNPSLFQSRTGRRIDRSSLERLFDHYAGLQGEKFRFHSLRHACALHLLQNQAGVRYIQELLGHSYPESTQIYTRLLPLDLKKAHNRFHPREKETAKHKREIPASSIQHPASRPEVSHG